MSRRPHVIFLMVFGILAASIGTVLLIGWGTYIPRPRIHEVRISGSHFTLRAWHGELPE